MKLKNPLLLLPALALNACSLDSETGLPDITHPPVGDVTISDSTPEQGQTLSATHDITDIDGAITVLGYQWHLDGEDVEGATGETFTLTQEHVGKTVSVRLSFTDGVDEDQTKISEATDPVADVNDEPTGEVTITGDNGTTFEPGHILTVSHTLEDIDGIDESTLAYAWFVGDTQDGDSDTYTIKSSDQVQSISAVVSYTDLAGFSHTVSSTVYDVQPDIINYEPTGEVVVTSDGADVAPGATLTASNTLADANGIDAATLVYTWFNNGAQAAVGATYLVPSSTEAQSIMVQATYSDELGYSHTVDSTTYDLDADLTPPSSTAYVCPTDDAQVYFCDDFEDGLFADTWDDKISTYGLDSPGIFDVLDDGSVKSLRFTAGTRGPSLTDGELILVKADAFAGVPTDYAMEYRIRPRNNGNTGNKYLYAMLRYESPLNWYLGGLNMQSSSTSTQIEAGYATAAPEVQRKLQVKHPFELGTTGETDGTWYTVRIDVVGNNLTAYVDGTQVGSWEDSSALYNSTGLIGFFTYNRSFEVDYVKVFDPSIIPVQLTVDADSTWVTAADGDPLVVNVTALQSDGVTPDAFTAESSNAGIVEVAIDGAQVTLTPKAAGTASITFTADSDTSVQRVIEATIEPAWFMPTTDYGSISGKVTPDVGATDEYIDGTFSITFDSAPSGLGTTGEVRIFDSNDNLVDRIKASGETYGVGLSGDGNTRVVNYDLLTLDGATLNIRPHSNILTYGETYTITIGDNVVMDAQLNGVTFDGLGATSGWDVTMKASGPASDATTLSVDDDGAADFRSVQGAMDWVMTNVAKETAATINIKNGTYNELLFLREKDNLSLIGESRDGVLIAAENYELLNTGSGKSATPGSRPGGGRSLFLVEGGDMLSIENVSITNTHLRAGSGDQAETIYFNSSIGRLVVKNSNFTSEQDTLLMKGYNWFYDSKISGNVDFIWGYSVATVFENSEIVTLGDSKVVAKGETTSSGGYVLQARVENETDPGFVFLNSTLSHEAGPAGVTVEAGSTYLARSGGDSKVFDNIVFVNTKMGDHIADIGWAYQGINGQPAPTPGTATADAGWREYNSMDLDGNALDLSSRCDANGSCYELTTAEYEANYCSRAQIFANFNNGEGWDPYPEDTSDDHCPAAQGEAWKGGAMVLGGSGTSADGTIASQSTDAVTFSATGGKFESSKVSFYMVSQDVKGDFTLTAKLKSIDGGILRENSSYQFPAGLMMCECDGTAATVGKMAHIGVNDTNGSGKNLSEATVDYVASYGHFLSAAEGTGWGKTGSTVVTPGDDLYYRLKRVGNAYYVYVSTTGVDGFDSHYGASNFSEDLPETMKVGFFAAPNGSSNEPTIVFEDITLTLD